MRPAGSLPGKRLAPQVVLLGFAALLNDVSSDMIYPLLPLFLTTVAGATPLAIGVIEGTAEALSSILKLGSGALSDRFPRRKPFIVGGYFLAGLSRLLIASATRWPQILTARLIDRTGKGIRSAPRDAMICDVTPVEHRGRAFGFHRALDHTGAVIGPLLAAFLLSVLHLPMRTVFLWATVPALAGVLLLVFGLREIPRVAGITSRVPAAARAKLPPRFWAALASVGLFALANSSDAFLILQAHRAGIATNMIPLLWALHHVVKSALSTYAGSLSDRRDRRVFLAAGWLMYAGVYATFPSVRTVGGFALLFVVYAIPFALTEGAEKAWISAFTTEGNRGRGFGYYYLAIGLLTLAGTLLFAVLYQEMGPQTAFLAGASLAILAAGTLLVQPAPLGQQAQ